MSKKLGTMIKKARTDKGLTQVQLGEAAGLTATQISRIEAGLLEPEKEALRKMAKPLGLTQKALLETAGLAEKSTAKKASGTSSAKKASGTSSAKKTSSTSKKTSSSDRKSDTDTLTATEKKLVKLYRKADAETKKDVMNTLEGKGALSGLLGSLFSGKADGLGALLGGKSDGLAALLGGKTEKTAAGDGPQQLSQEQMALVLQGLASLAKREQEEAEGLTLLRGTPDEEA